MAYIPLFWFVALEQYDGLERYVRSSESATARWRVRSRRRLQLRKSKDPDRQEYREYLYDAVHNEVVPRWSGYSHLLALWALNQANITLLCQVVSERIPPYRKPENVGRDFPTSGLEYLCSVVDPPPSPSRHVQQALEAARIVRNCVAHAGGVVRDLDQKKREPTRQAARRLGFRVSGGKKGRKPDGEIVIPRGTIQPLVRMSYRWFDDLYNPLHDRLMLGSKRHV